MGPDKTSAKVNAQNDVFLVQDFINVPEEVTVKDHLQISLLILSKIKRIN